MSVQTLREIYPFVVFLDNGEFFDGNMREFDIYSLNDVLYKFKPKTILEIGCWTGFCSCFFGLFLKQFGGKLWSIDNFKGSPDSNQSEKFASKAKDILLKNIKRNNLEDIWELLEGDSDAFASMDKKFDMIFIDADHRYSQVRKDIRNYLPKVNNGGVLAGHDFNKDEYDEEFIEQDFVKGNHHGVVKAVRELGRYKRFDNGSSIWFYHNVYHKEKERWD